VTGRSQTRYIPMAYFDSLAEARRTLRENSLLSLEFQTELLDWMGRPASLESYAGFMRVYGYVRIEDDDARRTHGEHLHGIVKTILRNASTYYVSPDMCEYVKMGAEAMPATGLKPTDLPSDTGFLLYDRPVSIMSELPATKDDGEVVMTTVETRVAGVAWQAGSVKKAPVINGNGQAPGFTEQGELTQGVSYYLFCTPHDMAVQLNQTQAQCGEDPVNEEMDVRRIHGPLPIYDFSGWAYNMPWFSTDENRGYSVVEGVEGEQEPLAGVHSLVDQGRRLILATWRILKQENVVVLDPNRPPRHMRRRGERAGIRSDEDIVIIRMRKEVYEGLQQAVEREGDEPWYTCRFWVQGHWHNYWVGPKGEQHIVEKFVGPYLKGPDGAPLHKNRKIVSLEE